MEWLEQRRIEAKGSLVGARLIGEHGVGKTRLLREFAERARAAQDVVVLTGPDPAWAEVGYYALRRAIGELAELPADGGTSKDWPAAGAEARRGLQDVFDQRPGSGNGSATATAPPTGTATPTVTPAQLRVCRPTSVATPRPKRFAGRSVARPSAVTARRAADAASSSLVDDLQNLDGASRNAFADAMGEPPLVPALMVVSYMPGTENNWPAMTAPSRAITGSRADHGQQAPRLRRLGERSVAHRRQGDRAVLRRAAASLRRRAGGGGTGSPRRPHRAAASSASRRMLAACSRRSPSSATPPTEGDDPSAPAGQHDHPRGARHARRQAEWWKRATTATAPRTRCCARWSWRPSRLQVRRGLHATAADICEELGAPLEVRALHEYHAQNTFQALLHLEGVGARCAARGDLAGNINALRRALELARRELFRGELDDPMRAVLIFSRKLGEALAQAGDYTDAEGVLREALDMAGPGGQDRARVLGALAHVAHGRERRVEAQVYLREALELARKHNVSDLVPSLEDLRRAIAP